MRDFLLCNPSSSSLSPPPPPPPTTHRRQKPLLNPTQKPSLIRSITGVALSINILFSSTISPVPSPSIAVEFNSSISQMDCREEDQRREVENRAPELVSNEEIVKEAWEIVNDSFLGSGSNRWSPQSWLVYFLSL